MKWTSEEISDLGGRTVIVTGANSGIGFETAKVLAEKGATVVMACRSLERGEAAKAKLLAETPDAQVELRGLDLSDLESVRAFADAFLTDHDALHTLINNAGVMIPPYATTKDGFELQIGTNHLGHFALTARLLPKLLGTQGARVVVVASTAHRWGWMRFDDLNWSRRRYSAWAAYGQSKLANLLFARELTRRLQAAGQKLIVASSHPGFTATNLTKHSSAIARVGPLVGMPHWQGALPSLYAAVADDVRPDDYFGPEGLLEIRGYPTRVGRTRRARSDADARRLWELSEEMTGIGAGDLLEHA